MFAWAHSQACAQNWLGVGIVLLVVAYHYLIADPSAST